MAPHHFQSGAMLASSFKMLFGLLNINQDILSQNWNSQHFSKPSSLTNNLYQFELICKQIICVVVTNVKHRLEAEARGSEGNIFFSCWAHLCPKLLVGAWAESLKLWDIIFIFMIIKESTFMLCKFALSESSDFLESKVSQMWIAVCCPSKTVRQECQKIKFGPRLVS